MGCSGSKAADKGFDGTTPLLPGKHGGHDSRGDAGSNRRSSVIHRAQEMEEEASETPFDDTVIGLLTRHGIAPARGALGSKAKINQARGVVCWPFNGSHNQALLCVFDGHGLSGERIAEYCAHEIPMRLEADRAALSIDPVKCLINNVRCGSFMPHCEDLSVS